ncbi:MAG: GntR family transcriptional regulator [Rhodomicrobiaceae bacterium]
MKAADTSERDLRIQKIAAPLRHTVTENIRIAIAVGRFKAGERLPEREVCDMLGVSRTLVREAFRQLESEGLIKVVPHRGPIVARLTPKQAEGVYQVREELEGLASRLFAENATPAHQKALREAFEEVKRAYRSNDPIVRIQAKNRFYECLVEGSGNEVLGNLLGMLNARSMLLRATSLAEPGRAKKSLAELSELMNALMSGDADAALDASRRHVHAAAAAALGLMTEAGQETAAE